ncbi:hypothetical protein [Microbacterium mangrovi]|uniref:hypothetical protein n=1 Tax=Microbacterium mangrovi TaxID=1348253 RepID=UPI0012E09FC3|nr:hypothetical protein [Microbacterium mangrovi]
MEKVWIVYHDSGPDNNILGVFDNPEDAEAYQAQEWPEYENGVLLTPFPVPWRATDGGMTIFIGD